MTKIISEYTEYEVDEYPRTCKECPFLQRRPYRDNAYTGVYYLCDLNYMDHGDTREFDVLRRRWKDCDIEHCKGVFLERSTMSKIMDQMYQLDRYPESCVECPFLREHFYQCHNERGTEFGCTLGYMKGYDTRDIHFKVENKRFCGDRIKSDPRVLVYL